MQLHVAHIFPALCAHQLSVPCAFRPAARATDRIYFRLSDVVGGHTQQVALNSEVSYVMVPDPRGNQDRAANVQILNTKFVADQLSMLPGQLHQHLPQIL